MYTHGVLGLSPETLDAEVLFNPFEEQFHLPTIAVEQGNVFGSEVEVVCIVDKRPSKVGGIVDNSSKRRRVVAKVPFACESDGLVEEDSVLSVKDVLSIKYLVLRLPFLPNDEERSAEVDCEETREVEVATVEDVTCKGLIINPVHSIGVVYFGVCDTVKHRYFCCDVDLRVDSDAGLGAAKECPAEDGHTEVDGCGIDCVETSVQFEFLGNTPFLCEGYHVERKLLVDTWVSKHVGFREGVSDDGSRTKAETVRPFGMSCSYICEFPKRAAACQLDKHKHKQMIPMCEFPSLSPVRVLRDNSPELTLGHERRDLSKNVASYMHSWSDIDSDPNIHNSNVGHKFYHSRCYESGLYKWYQQ